MIDLLYNEETGKLFRPMMEDLIYRDDAVRIADHLLKEITPDNPVEISDMAFAHNDGILKYKEKLQDLPGAYLPERQEACGHWIRMSDNEWACSECGAEYEFSSRGTPEENGYRYCPSCGWR